MTAIETTRKEIKNANAPHVVGLERIGEAQYFATLDNGASARLSFYNRTAVAYGYAGNVTAALYTINPDAIRKHAEKLESFTRAAEKRPEKKANDYINKIIALELYLNPPAFADMTGLTQYIATANA